MPAPRNLVPHLRALFMGPLFAAILGMVLGASAGSASAAGHCDPSSARSGFLRALQGRWGELPGLPRGPSYVRDEQELVRAGRRARAGSLANDGHRDGKHLFLVVRDERTGEVATYTSPEIPDLGVDPASGAPFRASHGSLLKEAAHDLRVASERDLSILAAGDYGIVRVFERQKGAMRLEVQELSNHSWLCSTPGERLPLARSELEAHGLEFPPEPFLRDASQDGTRLPGRAPAMREAERAGAAMLLAQHRTEEFRFLDQYLARVAELFPHPERLGAVDHWKVLDALVRLSLSSTVRNLPNRAQAWDDIEAAGQLVRMLRRDGLAGSVAELRAPRGSAALDFDAARRGLELLLQEETLLQPTPVGFGRRLGERAVPVPKVVPETSLAAAPVAPGKEALLDRLAERHGSVIRARESSPEARRRAALSAIVEYYAETGTVPVGEDPLWSRLGLSSRCFLGTGECAPGARMASSAFFSGPEEAWLGVKRWAAQEGVKFPLLDVQFKGEPSFLLRSEWRREAVERVLDWIRDHALDRLRDPERLDFGMEDGEVGLIGDRFMGRDKYAVGNSHRNSAIFDSFDDAWFAVRDAARLEGLEFRLLSVRTRGAVSARLRAAWQEEAVDLVLAWVVRKGKLPAPSDYGAGPGKVGVPYQRFVGAGAFAHDGSSAAMHPSTAIFGSPDEARAAIRARAARRGIRLPRIIK